LQAHGRPLHGVTVSLIQRPYDWNDAAPLHALVRSLTAQGAIVVASSEGALFEYAGDDAVTANLEALRAGAPALRLVAGSVTRADALTSAVIASSRIKLLPRGIDAFGSLARKAGFQIERAVSAVMSDQVLLRPL
jgi:hypothetical protein